MRRLLDEAERHTTAKEISSLEVASEGGTKFLYPRSHGATLI